MSIYSGIFWRCFFSRSVCHFFEKLVSISEYFLQYKSWFYWSSWLVMFGGRKKLWNGPFLEETITRSLSSRVWVQTRPVIRFGADFPLLKIMRFPAFCQIVFVFIFLQGVWWKKSFSWNSFWWHLQDTAWFAGKVLGRAGKNRSLLFVWYCTVCCKAEKSIVQSAVKLKKYCTVCCKDRRCLCPDSWQEKVSRSRNASPPREKWRRIA